MFIYRIIYFFHIRSKKSAPIRLIKEACEKVEALDGIPVRNSSLSASANLASLCHELQVTLHTKIKLCSFVLFYLVMGGISCFTLLGIFGFIRLDRIPHARALFCELYGPIGIVRFRYVFVSYMR